MNQSNPFMVLLILIISLSIQYEVGTSCLSQAKTQKNRWIEVNFEVENTLPSKFMIPLVITTWGFTEATSVAWNVLSSGGSALDAVEHGCSKCEELQCDRTVGFGGSPDENGETTLDAMIMDGETHSVGAVACLRRIKPAISVARKVMEHTKHSILAGDLATDFAIQMGFVEESLTTPESQQMHDSWKNNACQPNFWRNVQPDPAQSCGPYSPVDQSRPVDTESRFIDRDNHDTIGMVAIDSTGRIASGASSNGARNKIPGRVGDAPIVGAGSYVDKDVGGAAATGDGDVMMRFLPTLITVENMKNNMSPRAAAQDALARIARFYPTFRGGIVAANINGEFGAACHGLPDGFPFTVMNSTMDSIFVGNVPCSLNL